MGSPAADFSVVADRSFGTIVIRPSEKTKEVVVQPLRVPSVHTHEHHELARALEAQGDTGFEEISTVTTAADARGNATVVCSTLSGTEAERAALNAMRKLSHAQFLPVKLQSCVAACGVPSVTVPAPTGEEIAAQRCQQRQATTFAVVRK